MLKGVDCVFVPVLVEQVWDPLSRSQTALLVEFLHRLRKGYPTVLHGDNKYTQVGLCKLNKHLLGSRFGSGCFTVTVISASGASENDCAEDQTDSG